MDLSTIYTIIFIGILIVGGLIGVALGGLKMLTRLIGTIVCLALSFLLASNLCTQVYNNLIKDSVHEAVGNALVSIADNVKGVTADIIPEGVIEGAEGVVGDLKNNVGDSLNKFSFNFDLSNLDIADLLKNLQAKTDNDILKGTLGIVTDNISELGDIISKAKDSKKSLDKYICEDIIDPMGIELTKVILFLILFMILRIIVVFVTSMIDSLFKNTVVGGLNRVIGLAVGLICGIAIAYVVAVGIGLLSDMQMRTDIFSRRSVEESVIGNLLINFDVAKIQEVIINTAENAESSMSN